MKRMRFALAVLALALLVFGPLVSCAPAVAPTPSAPTPAPAAPAVSPEWQRVLGVARGEGSVTVYSGLGPTLMEVIIAELPKQTGIAAQVINIPASEAAEKIRLEQSTGTYVVDVMLAPGTSIDTVVIGPGFGQAISVELPVEKELQAFRVNPWQYDQGGRQAVVFQQDINPGVLVNTNLVKEGEIQSWYDLLNPRWKGKIIMTDPRFTVGGATAQAYAASELGLDFWKQMAQQNPTYDRKGDRVPQAVALGEKALAVFAKTTDTEAAILAGAPIKYIHLKEGSQVIVFMAAMVKNAPHPNAALVVINWLLSKQGHETVMRAQSRAGIRKDLDPTWLKIPEFRPEAVKRPFSKVATRAQHGQEGIAFMKEALGAP